MLISGALFHCVDLFSFWLLLRVYLCHQYSSHCGCYRFHTRINLWHFHHLCWKNWNLHLFCLYSSPLWIVWSKRNATGCSLGVLQRRHIAVTAGSCAGLPSLHGRKSCLLSALTASHRLLFCPHWKHRFFCHRIKCGGITKWKYFFHGTCLQYGFFFSVSLLILFEL